MPLPTRRRGFRTSGVHRLRRHRWLALALIVPGLVLRAAIPPGFMPAAGPDAAFEMQMCPGHSTMPMPAAPAPGTDQPSEPGEHHEAPCVFAAAAGAAPLPDAVGLAYGTAAEPPAPSPRTTLVPMRPVVRANAPRAPPVPS
jgi:hypothetical protein